MIGLAPKDELWISAGANGQKITTETPQRIYKSGDGATLPARERRRLDLDPDDSVKYWIYPAENLGDDESPAKDAANEEQQNLSDTVDEESHSDTVSNDSTVADEEFAEDVVWLKDTDPTVYHRVHPNNRDQTICGIDHQTHDYDFISEVGPLSECSECATHPSESLMNAELVESIGDEVGFEVDDDTRENYLKREQPIRIREHLITEEENRSQRAAG